MNRDIPFVDKNNERRYLIMRVRQIIDVIRGKVFTDSIDAGDFEYSAGQENTDEASDNWTLFTKNDFWGERELYCRFRQTVTIPENMRGKKIAYCITCFPDSHWNSSAQQFILYINGKLVQGIDHNHTFVFLTENANPGEKFDIFLRAYYDDNSFRGKSQLCSFLRVYHDEVNRIYYDLENLWQSAHLLGADSEERSDIVNAMNTACNIIELNSGDEAFYESCIGASNYLADTVFGHGRDVTMSAIGHTHIDVAWRWRLRQTREKAGRSFATVLNLMKEYPDYKFMSPQAQLYDYVKQDYPEVFEGIKNAVAEKRWEPEGSMWVESDTNIISGESLVRQFLYGKGFFKKEFGVDTKIMWLPDVFGYSASLPQIIKKSGIDYFMTTKISWNEYTRFPYDTFMWEGIDGTSVLSHFIACRDEDDKDEWGTTYNASLTPQTAYYTWKRYSHKDLNKNYLCSFGHGDGGGGPERSYLENSERLKKGIPGIPCVKQEFALDFFRRLDSEVSSNKYLPSWRGELYLEYHRGTLTSQARNKKYNRKSEYLLHNVETLATVSKLLTGSDYPKEKIDSLWKLVLLNQFHDIIPGSSIENVYIDSKEQYEKVIDEGNQLLRDAINSLSDYSGAGDNDIIVFNTLGFNRSSDVTLDNVPEGAFCVFDGNTELPTQRTYDGKLIFRAVNVPSKGFKVFKLVNRECSLSAINATLESAETDEYSVKFDENMNISSLLHNKSGRFVAPEGETLGAITAYEDRPHVYEAWDIKCYYDEKSYPLTAVDNAAVIENGPVRTVIKVDRHFRESSLSQYYIFSNTSGRIDIDYDIDWKQKNIALKADYPVDVNTDRATFDIQFGNIERSTTENTINDFAQFEVCGHKWADLSDSSFGFSVLNDCKYGWTVKHGHIRPTLLRSATNPNVNQDRERHQFTYSLAAHEGEVRTSDVNSKALDLNVPLIAVLSKENHGKQENKEFSFVSCDCDNIVIETVKESEDGDSVVIRMYETLNKRCNATISLGLPFKSVHTCNLMEDTDKELVISGDTLSLEFRPFEIKTLKMQF